MYKPWKSVAESNWWVAALIKPAPASEDHVSHALATKMIPINVIIA